MEFLDGNHEPYGRIQKAKVTVLFTKRSSNSLTGGVSSIKKPKPELKISDISQFTGSGSYSEIVLPHLVNEPSRLSISQLIQVDKARSRVHVARLPYVKLAYFSRTRTFAFVPVNTAFHDDSFEDLVRFDPGFSLSLIGQSSGGSQHRPSQSVTADLLATSSGQVTPSEPL